MASVLQPVGNLPNSGGSSLTGILDYNTLKSYNRENLCEIWVEGNTSQAISGIVNPDSTSKFTVNATYEPLFDQSQWTKKIQTPVNAGSAAWDQPQVMIHSLRLSEESFKGFNADNNFGIQLQVPVMSESDNPAALAARVLSFACGLRMSGPNSGAWGSAHGEGKVKVFGQEVGSEFLLYAPNKYRIIYRGSGSDKSGAGGANDEPYHATCISVGSRYLYEHCLVTRASAEFSDTVYHDGKPTWLTLSLNFKYWRQIDISTLQSFLRIHTWGGK